jgi:hypothetical protein
MEPARRVRLCLSDLFHQDVVEMIERETRKYSMWNIEHPDDPEFKTAYQMLWEAFGPQGEMEREDAIRGFLLDDAYEPTLTGSFIRYFLIIAKDAEGRVRGVRDGSVLINPGYAPDLCLVYLSHIYMMPEARGTVLSYALRISPVDIAMQYLFDLAKMGKVQLPKPDAPGKYFGMRMDLAAEMEYFDPADRISWQRILFYGRGGFDAINPRHFPYRQPDFREPSEILRTGNHPVPLMLLLRRLGRERQATLPLDEARAVIRLLYDEFACHCSIELLDNSLKLVLDRLNERAKDNDFVELFPLPTGPRDLNRLKRLFRPRVFQRYYPESPETKEYLEGDVKTRLASSPTYLEDELAKISVELEKRPSYVYANRDKHFTWDGVPVEPPRAEPDDAA